jgi:5-methylcytosine-specific restriction protein B
VESATWSGYLELTRDWIFNSASAAAEILVGRSANGWTEWKTADGRPLREFLTEVSWGPSRTWLVRGSNVSDLDLVQRMWLPEQRISLAAGRLRQGVTQGMSKDQLRGYVEEDYESTATYGQKRELVDEFHAFLLRMRPGDTVCTISNGHLYVGEITGDAEQVASEGDRSNLRRPVEWQSIGYPYDELPEELQQRLSIQRDVVDLTSVGALVAGLGRSDEELAAEAADTDAMATRAGRSRCSRPAASWSCPCRPRNSRTNC